MNEIFFKRTNLKVVESKDPDYPGISIYTNEQDLVCTIEKTNNLELRIICYKENYDEPYKIMTYDNYIKKKLTTKQKNKLINLFFNSYYNTDIASDIFGSEFYYVTRDIMDNKIPLHLKYLNVFEIKNQIMKILEEEK